MINKEKLSSLLNNLPENITLEKVTNRKMNEDGIYPDITCPECHKKDCVQGLISYDLTTKWNKPKNLFRCCECDYRWDDEEGNRIEDLKEYCIKIIDECSEEGLESMSNLANIIKLYRTQKEVNV